MNEVRGGAYGKIKGKGEGQADQAKHDWGGGRVPDYSDSGAGVYRSVYLADSEFF